MNGQLKQYISRLKEYPILQSSMPVGYKLSFSLDAKNACIEDFPHEACFKGENDTLRTISLMDFVHNELFSTGEIVEPEVRNTAGIMAVRKRGSLFCWCYATVMAEMLLALNRKATVVSCLPKTFDCDSHAAVLTYLEDAGKWAFFDPTFNTYFAGRSGEPLDILEIRAAYASEVTPQFEPIPIQKEWVLVLNGIVYETYEEWYRVYMAKNTFRFILPAENFYGAYDRANDSKMRYCISPENYSDRNEYDAAYPNIIYPDGDLFSVK